ncbi:MAG: VOC family protein [Fimbriimonas sp.]
MATSIQPILFVRQGSRAVEFYKAAFGAIELYRIEDPGGSVLCELSADGAKFWVSDESPDHASFSPETLHGGSVRMVLMVENPDSAFERAILAGARAVVPMGDSYGWRTGRVVDPYGHY